MISVYITSFNKGKYISQAISSVLNQTLKPNEVVIVDDGSGDESREIINGYYSRYPKLIKTIFNEKNLGVSRTRNIALYNCKNDFITFLDADDIFYEKKLEYEKNKLKEENVQITYSNFNYISPNGEVLGKFSNKEDTPAIGDIIENTFIRNYNVTSGSNYIYEMFYKNCLDKSGFYDENINLWEDWDFRIRMSKYFRYNYCPHVNSAYRQLDNGLSNANNELHFREQIKIINKNKYLIKFINNSNIRLIMNRIFSKVKNNFQQTIKSELKNGKYFKIFLYSILLIKTFKTKKSLKFIINILINK